MVRGANGRRVIFQRFSGRAEGRFFPYPPLYVETDTDYICFTDDIHVKSSIWEIQIVEEPERADLEHYLKKYTVRRELHPKQIQMGELLSAPYTDENIVTVPSLEELPLAQFDTQNLAPTADAEGNYFYRRNPVYREGKYNGRPLLLTIGVPVSNQIDTIDRCLSQIKPLLEQLDAELLVIDTGSTDGTVEVCKGYGARIITYPWCDNMSAVRNEGIYNARGEWYFSIDDDEWFEDVEEILQFFKQGTYQNYDMASYIQRNYMDSAGTTYEDNHTLRMARITPGLHFEGRIHDALLVEQGGHDRGCVLCSYAHHYGFVGDRPERSMEKFIRNTTLLLEDIYEYPMDLRYQFQLANEFLAAHYNETAMKLFVKVIAQAKEIGSMHQGKGSVVSLMACLYEMDDPRLFSWAEKLIPLFPLTVPEQAFIAWCRESMAFLTDRPPEQVLEYYCAYKSRLEEYQKDPGVVPYGTHYGLEAVQQERYIMDAEAIAFCTCLDMGREEDALGILPRISMETIRERRIAVLASGLAAGDGVYKAVCGKLNTIQWEEWSEEILNAFMAGIRRGRACGNLQERLYDLLAWLSVPSVISWFKHAGERRKGKVGVRLLEFALGCDIEKTPVQALCLYALVLREAYVEYRTTENGKGILFRYLFVLGTFAERYYNRDLLIDAECCAISQDIRAVYRMAVVLADGRVSHENVELLKQALVLFPSFYNEIRNILAELKG